jgi:UDP-N-acetylmuramyl tripeptide synthase
MRHLFAILAAKFAALLIKILRLGSGVTWPGEIALQIDPGFLEKTIFRKYQIILITGTNGKTTTAKMLETILVKAGKKVFRNDTGANLKNGITGTLINKMDFFGKLPAQTLIFEVDEAAFSQVAPALKPQVAVFLNLFRDQLDRYGELDSLAESWKSTLRQLSGETCLIVNGDDPHLVSLTLGSCQPVSYFGIDDQARSVNNIEHAADSIFCPHCGTKLTYGAIYFSHLGKWACSRCRLTHPDLSIRARDVISPLEGTYNLYNTLASILAAEILGGVKRHIAVGHLKGFPPAFGRLESLTYAGSAIRILLSKNPTGANESLRTYINSTQKGPLLFVLNDRIPDGTDVSWIWDVDFELLMDSKEKIVLSGDRVYDLAVRFKYAGIKKEQIAVEPDLITAVNRLVQSAGNRKAGWVMPTYSAMLDVRGYLTGKKIL